MFELRKIIKYQFKNRPLLENINASVLSVYLAGKLVH